MYNALFSKEKMKYPVGSEAKNGEGLIVHGVHGRDRLKSNFSNQVFLLKNKRTHQDGLQQVVE